MRAHGSGEQKSLLSICDLTDLGHRHSKDDLRSVLVINKVRAPGPSDNLILDAIVLNRIVLNKHQQHSPYSLYSHIITFVSSINIQLLSEDEASNTNNVRSLKKKSI